jgi:tetratricopeptide (TPR) repeat protein
VEADSHDVEIVLDGAELKLVYRTPNRYSQAIEKYKNECQQIKLEDTVLSKSDWAIIQSMPILDSVSICPTKEGIWQLAELSKCKKLKSLSILFKDGVCFDDLKSDMPIFDSLHGLTIKYDGDARPAPRNRSFRLALFPNLKSLELSVGWKNKEDYVDIKELIQLRNTLTKLVLSAHCIKNAEMFGQIDRLRNLHLELEEAKALLLPLSITELDFYLGNPDEQSIRQLSRLKNLKSLKYSCYESKSEVRFLASIPSVESLELKSGKFDDEDLRFLGSMPNLKTLVVTGNGDYTLHPGYINGTFLSSFSENSKLRGLVLHADRLNHAGVKALCRLKLLESLQLLPKANDFGSHSLVRERVEIDSSWSSDFKSLVNLRSLRGICVKVGADKWADALGSMPYLQEIDLNNTDFSDSGIIGLQGCRNLEQLDLSETILTGATLDRLNSLSHLKTLCLNQCNLSDKGMASLGKLDKISSLYLSNADFDSSKLSCFFSMRQLKQLDLSGCELSDEAMKSIANISSLDVLDIAGAKFDESALKELAYSNISELNLSGTSTTKNGLAYTKRLKNLKQVNTYGCPLDGREINRADEEHTIRIPAAPADIGYIDEQISFSTVPESKLLQSLEAANKAVQTASMEESGYEDRAFILIKLRRYKQSLPDFERAIYEKEHPKFYVCSQIASSWTRDLLNLYRAKLYADLMTKSYQSAIYDASRAMRLNHLSVQSRLARAYAYMKLNELDLAMRDLNKALQINFLCADAYAYKAMIFQKQGKQLESFANQAMASILLFKKKFPD